uniref:Uncharacterized protein n=1 Tax=Amphimedon queenslandica TaxID=400682 RepID=A0A1X7U084_AMPQE
TVLSYSYCSGNVNDDPFAEVRRWSLYLIMWQYVTI